LELEKKEEISFMDKKEIVLADDCVVTISRNKIIVETFGYKLVADIQKKKAIIYQKKW